MPPGATRVVLWRHGRTAANAEGRFQGQLDVPLDDVGAAQVGVAASLLAELGPTALVSSDLARASATADALAAVTGLPVVLDPALREVWAGAWEGLLNAEIRARWPQEQAAWASGEDVRVGGGERRSQVGRRVAAAVRAHAGATDDDGTLVVVSHSAALRAGVLDLLELPAAAWPRLASLRNAGWAVLGRRGAGWSLTGYGLGAPAAV